MPYTLRTKHCVIVKRKTARPLFPIFGPVGIKTRKQDSKFHTRTYHAEVPMLLWHVDGYDKLAPNCLYVSDATNSFSLKIIWLNVAHTNKDQKQIEPFYLEGIRKHDCPIKILTDSGRIVVYNDVCCKAPTKLPIIRNPDYKNEICKNDTY